MAKKKLTVADKLINIQNERNLVRRKKRDDEAEQDAADDVSTKCDERIEAKKMQLAKLLAAEIRIGEVIKGTRWSIRPTEVGLILTEAKCNADFKTFLSDNIDGIDWNIIELSRGGVRLNVATDYHGKKVKKVIIKDDYNDEMEMAKWLKERGASVTNSEGKNRMKEIKRQITDLKEELKELEAVEATGTHE